MTAKRKTSKTAAPSTDSSKIAQAEFSSVILTLDHMTTREDGHSVQKFVGSTQDVTETLLSLFAYYGQTALTLDVDTIKLFQEAARCSRPVWCYNTGENVQIILSAETFSYVVNSLEMGGGSLFRASRILIDALGDVEEGLLVSSSEDKGGVPLFFMTID